MSDEGENYDVKVCAPGNSTPEEIAACVRIIEEGRAVDPNSAAAELPHAKVIAVAFRNGDIVGVGAIKRLRPAYASEVAKKSTGTFGRDRSELGYVAIEPKHRGHGLSHRIVVELLAKHKGPLFATTDDDRMKRTLRKSGFEQIGNEWRGKRGLLSLWVRG